MRILIFLLLAAFALLQGCADSTNQRLDEMNVNTGRMVYEMEKDREYIASILEEIKAIENSFVSMNSEINEGLNTADIYGKYLKSLVAAMEKIARSLGEFEKMGTDMRQLVRESLFKPTAPAKTRDIEEVL